MCHRFAAAAARAHVNAAHKEIGDSVAAAAAALAADARFDREHTVARPRAGADARTPRLAAFVRPRRVYASGRGVSGGGGTVR